MYSLIVAEREGFEPSVGFKPTHDFQSCALDQLSHLSASDKLVAHALLLY